MTMQELYQLRDLRREIRMDEERLAEMETRATHITQTLSGMPAGGGDGKKLEREAVAIADLRSLLEDKRARCQSQLLQLERYIQSIPDSLTRQIFTLRFAEGKSWAKVAETIGYSERHIYRLNKLVQRTLEKDNKGTGNHIV